LRRRARSGSTGNAPLDESGTLDQATREFLAKDEELVQASKSRLETLKKAADARKKRRTKTARIRNAAGKAEKLKS
jgi:hypothetical protein